MADTIVLDGEVRDLGEQNAGGRIVTFGVPGRAGDISITAETVILKRHGEIASYDFGFTEIFQDYPNIGRTGNQRGQKNHCQIQRTVIYSCCKT